MAFDISLLARQPMLAEVDQREARLVVTSRLWVSMRKRGLDPTATIEQRLGSEMAACRFWLLMEEVGAAWPEPFIVSPPCCGRMSSDEASLLAVLNHADGGRRLECLAMLRDMIPLELADRLYATARNFLDALPQPVRAARAD